LSLLLLLAQLELLFRKTEISFLLFQSLGFFLFGDNSRI